MLDQSQSVSVLYKSAIFGYLPEWFLACLVVPAAMVVLFLMLWRPWMQSRRNRLCCSRSFFLAAWSTLIGFCVLTWLWTIDKEQEGGWGICLLMFAGAVVILGLTFLLEGLEAAYADLHDKDKQQLSAQAAEMLDRM